MTSLRISTEVEKLPKRKDGFYRKKPVAVFYNIFVDGELEARIRRAYGLVDGKLLLKGAVDTFVAELKARYEHYITINRAIADFNAQMESSKVEMTVEV